MSHRSTTNKPTSRSHTPAEIIASLPAGDYTHSHQPTYSNQDVLHSSLQALQKLKPITTPKHIIKLRKALHEIAIGNSSAPLIITGPCAEAVDTTLSVEHALERALRDRRAVRSGLQRTAVHILRNRGQNTKPRSRGTEQLPDGKIVAAYMGDAVNGQALDERMPDPARMITAATQASRIEVALRLVVGDHIPAAHEALLLPYEKSYLHSDQTGKTYILSTDMPWIGERTRTLKGEHIKLLTGIENPVGIKIGDSATPEYIAAIIKTLNPERIPGKLVFMLRTTPANTEVRHKILTAIHEYGIESIILYDIHGVTRVGAGGEKIRCVPEIIADIQSLAIACRTINLKLHGLHLETIHDNERLECVDAPDQLPTHPGGIDPQLNPRQTERVLREVASYLL